MKIILSVFLLLLVFNGINAEKELFKSCPELEGSSIGMVAGWLSKKNTYKSSKFFFALKGETHNDSLLEINSENLSTLKKNVFDVSLQTYVIIHGFKSNYQKPWVLEMKNKLLKNNNANVLLVDWRESAFSWNYIDSVRATLKVSNDLFRLLQSMKAKIPRIKGNSPSWNHLHFIGHSLGAHIAGQTGYLLRQNDSFFKVKRITGLDPASPCYTNAELIVKLDKQDADFVDVIHTQTSVLGLKTPIGHVDFYVNGGVMQAACESDTFLDDFKNLFCSHRMAYRYFLESMNNNKSCPIVAHPWDQSLSNANQILENLNNDKICVGCIELGKNISNKVENYGTYLVFASAQAPYCSLKKDDIPKIQKKLQLLVPSKSKMSLLKPLLKIIMPKK